MNCDEQLGRLAVQTGTSRLGRRVDRNERGGGGVDGVVDRQTSG